MLILSCREARVGACLRFAHRLRVLCISFLLTVASLHRGFERPKRIECNEPLALTPLSVVCCSEWCRSRCVSGLDEEMHSCANTRHCVSVKLSKRHAAATAHQHRKIRCVAHGWKRRSILNERRDQPQNVPASRQRWRTTAHSIWERLLIVENKFANGRVTDGVIEQVGVHAKVRC
jgi:hypothetical protein